MADIPTTEPSDIRAGDTIKWKDFGTKAVSLLEKLGKKYMLKKDLAAYL